MDSVRTDCSQTGNRLMVPTILAFLLLFSFQHIFIRLSSVLEDSWDLAGMLQVGHWVVYGGRSRRVGKGGALVTRPPHGPGAPLKLEVLHLGTDSRNVGLENANFVPDLREEEKKDTSGIKRVSF